MAAGVQVPVSRGPGAEAASLTKIKVERAAEACKAATLSEPARALLTPELSVPAFLDVLT